MKVAAIIAVTISSLALCAVAINFIVQIDVHGSEEDMNNMRASIALMENMNASSQIDDATNSQGKMAISVFRLAWIRYLLILVAVVNEVAIVMLRRLRFIGIGLLVLTPVLLAAYVPLSLVATFPAVLGAILASFVLRKQDANA